MRPRDAVPAIGVFAVALGYLLLLRPYGFQLEDEGTLLFWFDRVSRGQQPYVDFHTGYTPGFFAFGKAVFSVFGPSAIALRGVLAVMNAVTAAGLAEITRRLAGSRLAPVAPLLWLAFMPVYVGEFAAFNVPYPTWPVTLAWTGLALAMLSWVEKPRTGILVFAGAAAALAMGMRPNSGAFALAAATWIVVATASRRTALNRASAVAASAFMALGAWYTFEFRVTGSDAFVHLLPTFAIAALAAGPLAARAARDDAPAALPSLAVLAAAFVLPTLAWTLPLLSTLGKDRFLYEVFLVGADYQSLYYKAHPSPEPYALVVVAAALAFAAGGRLVASGVAKPLVLLASFAAAAVFAKFALLRPGLAPEGVAASVLAQLENASYWLALTANFGAVAWLVRVSRAELASSPRARAMLVATPLAIAMYLQMYPRSDFMHQVSAVPLTAAVACGLLHRVSRWWARGEWPDGWSGKRVVRGAVTAAFAAVLVLAFGVKVRGPVEAWSNREPRIAMPRRLDVRVEDAAGDEVAAVAATVDFLATRTSEGEALWSFPATSGLLFAAGRANVAPHDYWFPGRPDHAEEARVLGLLEQGSPRYIVTLGRGWDFFAGAPAYFRDVHAFVVARYRLAARFGRYDVLERRDLVAADARVATMEPRAPGTRDAVLDGNLERRRQAAWRWMDAVTPEDAAAAALPVDPRDAILLLRALRDGGDLRGAAWAVVGHESFEPRVRAEAADAMRAMATAFDAQKWRLANDFDPAALRPYVAMLADRVRPLEGDPALRPFANAVLELAGGEAPRAYAQANPASVSTLSR